jgi:hypothetical protein
LHALEGFLILEIKMAAVLREILRKYLEWEQKQVFFLKTTKRVAIFTLYFYEAGFEKRNFFSFRLSIFTFPSVSFRFLALDIFFHFVSF